VDSFAKRIPEIIRKIEKAVIVTLHEEVLGRFAGTLVLLFGAWWSAADRCGMSRSLLARGLRDSMSLRCGLQPARTRPG